jgi:hypothetical protein
VGQLVLQHWDGSIPLSIESSPASQQVPKVARG